MPVPTPHTGPCKRCNRAHADDGRQLDVCGLGRYRGLCEECRPIVATEQAQARLAKAGSRIDDGIDEDTKKRTKQPQLARVVQDLVPLAERLEQAIQGKEQAHSHARTQLMHFREGLQLVGRVAQSLVNQQKPADEG